MISIVICSINNYFAEQIKDNIESSIGVAFEIIIINNSENPKSLAQVYNEAASKARYEILCFVHEDVFFRTQHWGDTILRYFTSDPGLGLIGIAGSKYKSETVSGWYTGIQAYDCCSILHLTRENKEERIFFSPDLGKKEHDVVTLDGVFLCCRKKVWKEVRFNEKLLKGFHLYDLDFSLRTSLKYRVIVTFEIDLVHIVKGNHYGDSWLVETLSWHNANRGLLPGTLKDTPKIKSAEDIIRKTWLIRLKHEKISLANKLKWLMTCRVWRDILVWPYAVKFIFKKSKS